MFVTQCYYTLVTDKQRFQHSTVYNAAAQQASDISPGSLGRVHGLLLVRFTTTDLATSWSPTGNNKLPCSCLFYFCWLITLKSFQTHQDAEIALGLSFSSVRVGCVSKTPILQPPGWPICSESPRHVGTAQHCGARLHWRLETPPLKLLLWKKREILFQL